VAGKIAVGFFRRDCGGVFSGYDDLAPLGASLSIRGQEPPFET